MSVIKAVLAVEMGVTEAGGLEGRKGCLTLPSPFYLSVSEQKMETHYSKWTE